MLFSPHFWGPRRGWKEHREGRDAIGEGGILWARKRDRGSVLRVVELIRSSMGRVCQYVFALKTGGALWKGRIGAALPFSPAKARNRNPVNR